MIVVVVMLTSKVPHREFKLARSLWTKMPLRNDVVYYYLMNVDSVGPVF